jgi:hypothetical protein
MVPQLQFQARAALVFGELHDSIPMDRVQGISYYTTVRGVRNVGPTGGTAILPPGVRGVRNVGSS